MRAIELIVIVALLAMTYNLSGCAAAGEKHPAANFEPVWKPEFQHSLDYAQAQLRQTLAHNKDTNQFPGEVEDGQTWKTVKSDNWTCGFFPGCLWLMYEATGDNYWRENGEKWLAGLEKERKNDTTHDIGLMMYPAYGAAWRLTGNPAYKPILLDSARSLAARFRPAVGCTRSWGDKNDDGIYLVIIDNMMCLELLHWGAKNGGGAEMKEMAVSHARKTTANHVRPDGSTYHVLVYNPITGVVQGGFNSQGYTKESCWSRGLAWAVYGFTMTYRETGSAEFLATAEKCADYFLEQVPSDGIPFWDFQAPGQRVGQSPTLPNPAKRDASAAAICASGLIELAQFSKDQGRREKYLRGAERILTSLSRPPYLTEGTRSPAILQHEVISWRDSLDDKVRSLIYGDYYFIEALLRYKKLVNKEKS